MTPDEQVAVARRRYAVVQLCAAGGVVVMIAGIALAAAGNRPVLGWPLFAIGFALSMLVPRVLVRRWRTPPGP